MWHPSRAVRKKLRTQIGAKALEKVNAPKEDWEQREIFPEHASCYFSAPLNNRRSAIETEIEQKVNERTPNQRTLHFSLSLRGYTYDHNPTHVSPTFIEEDFPDETVEELASLMSYHKHLSEQIDEVEYLFRNLLGFSPPSDAIAELIPDEHWKSIPPRIRTHIDSLHFQQVWTENEKAQFNDLVERNQETLDIIKQQLMINILEELD